MKGIRLIVTNHAKERYQQRIAKPGRNNAVSDILTLAHNGEIRRGVKVGRSKRKINVIVNGDIIFVIKKGNFYNQFKILTVFKNMGIRL